MPGKHIPCALCQDEAAAVYCVNDDDAHLCGSCDVSVHAGNPLLARHERRQLSCQAVECASAANTSCTDADVAVVPQLGAAAGTESAPPAAASFFGAAPKEAEAAAVVAPAPLALYEDSFFARSLTASDLLMDMEDDELELPGGASFASFDPLVDCVVPSFDATAGGSSYLDASASSGFGSSQHTTAFLPPYMRQQQYQQQQPAALVPFGSAPAAPARLAAAKPVPSKPVDPAAEALRVQRHREKQRKKRAFGRAVRYQVGAAALPLPACQLLDGCCCGKSACCCELHTWLQQPPRLFPMLTPACPSPPPACPPLPVLQSRRAYAEIRPRIKGRFVTPEEYAAATGTAAPADAAVPAAAAPAEKAGGPLHLGGYAPPAAAMPALSEEDGVVPMPATYLLA